MKPLARDTRAFRRRNQSPKDIPMTNSRLWLLCIFAVVCFLGATTVRAETINLRNPFRGYNVSGINYGSQQWEKANRRQQPPSNQQNHRVIFRRRSWSSRSREPHAPPPVRMIHGECPVESGWCFASRTGTILLTPDARRTARHPARTDRTDDVQERAGRLLEKGACRVTFAGGLSNATIDRGIRLCYGGCYTRTW